MSKTGSAVDRRLLRPLTLQLLRLHGFALRHERWTLGGSGLLVLALLPFLGRVEVHLSIREMIDDEMEAAVDQLRMDTAFGRDNGVFLLFRPGAEHAALDGEASRSLERWIHDWERRDRVQSLESPLQLMRAEGRGDSLVLHRRLTDLSAASLATLRGTPWQGLLTDDDCRDVGVRVGLKDSPRPGRYGSFDPSEVGRLLEDVQEKILDPHPTVRAFASGPAVFEYTSLEGVRRFRWLNFGVVVLLVVLARGTLGTWRAGFLMLLPLGLASVVVYAGMALRGDPIDLLSTGLFLLLAVAAIEDFYFLSRVRMESGSRWRSPFRRLSLPGFLTSLTTVLGFGSLLASDLGMVRRLGTWAATGALVEWGATFLILPAVLQRWPATRSWTDSRRVWGAMCFERWARWRWPRRGAMAAFGVYVLAGLAVFRVDFDDSPERTFDVDHPYRRATTEVRDSRGWAGSFSVVAPPIDAEESLAERWSRLNEVLRLMRPWEEVKIVLDPRRVLEDAIGKTGSESELRARLETGGNELDAFGMVGADGSLRAELFVRDLDLESIATLRDFVRWRGEESGVYPAGELISYADFAEAVPRALLESLLACLALVGGLLALVARARASNSMLPILGASFLGPALVTVAVAVFRIPVNYLTCVFACVLVGLTGDNAVQYLCVTAPGRGRLPLAEGAARRGVASIQMAFVMSLSCLVFLGSAFVASRRLGMLLALGFVASLVGDLWVLRSVATDRRNA